MKQTLTALALMASLSVFASEESFVAEILKKPVLPQAQLERHAQLMQGGTLIGGGVVIEGLIAWCDQASGILLDARIEAREAWGMSGDHVEALGLYRNGLTLAHQSAPEQQTQGQLFTLRYVQRGLTLAQILGVDDILAGRRLVIGQAGGLINFFDWYVGLIINVGEELDRPIYIPYLVQYHCNNCHEIPRRIFEVDKRTVQISISVLHELNTRFVHTQADGNNNYSSIQVPTYMSALSYLLQQVAGDLRDSLFAESLVCQAARMEALAEKINRYLNNRQDHSQDAIHLNRFTLTLKDILNKISNGSCF